ncbi:PH domain-containing protein [Deinococcus cellulosilyticus]|uniref:Bacterial Pleckstrin homology domain-containing protein n=1 Tax=Deinococcus cellulosilyticus (strain DSM 18568 / NBRC 106333 / KACC 11606 / 5516J-15) TaxID=1223518 RepID=A0A511N9B0_DEIC1|nr:PH domain-containing protein [Deinococcus cellulosilyticus]GEM49429.1 hypothetical protein DC3_50640 [Deinococcus cellulosilyticus NBRC 106333 = KACC 11606]
MQTVFTPHPPEKSRLTLWWIFSAIMVLLTLYVFWVTRNAESQNFVPSFVLLVISLFILGICLLAVLGPMRMRYIITDQSLILRGFAGEQKLALQDLRAQVLEPSISLRMIGTGVPGYFTGLYSSQQGNIRVVATTTSRGILLEHPRGKVFITPEDEELFLQILIQRQRSLKTAV